MHPQTSATIRPDLAAAVSEYAMTLDEFMGLKILADIGVPDKSATFGKLEAAEADKKPASNKRAPGSKYERVERKVTTDNYTCEEYGQEEAIDDGDSANLARYFNAEADAAQLATYNTFYQLESRLATLFWNNTLFSSSYQQAAGTTWSTKATAYPVKNVADAIAKLKTNMKGLAGAADLVLAMNDTIYNYLVDCTDIKDRFNYVGGLQRGAQKAAIAAALGVDEIVTSSLTSLWSSSYALLALRSSSMQLRSVPRLGNVFRWDQDCPDNALVETYRDETIRSNVVRVRQHVDEKILNVRCGILITGVS
jgi:hypothetical protein